MSKNASHDNDLDSKWINAILELQKQIKQLRTNQLSVIVIPILTADPVTLTNGQIWYNSTSNTFKCYQGGAIKTFTVA